MEPQHLRIAGDLMEKIDEGDYAPGAQLPTEEELMREWGTSRNTVRRALQELANRGRIDTKQGSGSTVRRYRPTLHLASPAPAGSDAERYESYINRLREEEGRLPTERLEVGREPATGVLAGLLKLDPGDPRAFVVIRRCDRVVGPQLWQRQESYYPGFIAEGTELELPTDIPGGTKDVIAGLGYPQTGAWDVIGAKMPSLKDSSRFGIGPGVPLLVHERVAYSGQTPIRFTRTTMPADRHKLFYAEGDIDPAILSTITDVSVYER
ncbi:GntR family transcriptional regulator [Streptomonospora sp. S1-112]|uniref:GntR family transcriptional regulator n=1 Tax=Streptomonospora mangrovi TaxID=2883123 RepID=A0A9X3SGH1_9ACTN|nr:GntR family transcriptional regulator [Streptomonospora mangrovi]MDA0565980.1 GntR family transcriptional regulator [Streptomonospora mangrovi]